MFNVDGRLLKSGNYEQTKSELLHERRTIPEGKLETKQDTIPRTECWNIKTIEFMCDTSNLKIIPSDFQLLLQLSGIKFMEFPLYTSNKSYSKYSTCLDFDLYYWQPKPFLINSLVHWKFLISHKLLVDCEIRLHGEKIIKL